MAEDGEEEAGISLKSIVKQVQASKNSAEHQNRVMFDKYIQDFRDDNYPEKFVQELFTKYSAARAEKEILKLKHAGEFAEREMRAQMVKHYQRYIRMAEETKELAGPMSRMRSRLHDLRDVCTQLRDRAEGDARAISAAKEQGLIDTMNQAARDQLTAGSDAAPSEASMEELETDLDNLDVLMSERKFEEAVDAIQRLQLQAGDKKSLISPQARALQRVAIDKRLSSLTGGLCRELMNPTVRRTESRYIIELLIKLRQVERAKQIYLRNRSSWLKAKLRQLQMQKEVKDTVIELAQLFFGCIKTTHNDFTSFFRDPRLLSSFVEETETFWSHCRKHVVTVINCKQMAECVECARKKCVEMLDPGQVNLGFHLDRLIHPDLCDEINDRMNQSADEVRPMIKADDWTLALTPFKEYKLNLDVTYIGIKEEDAWLSYMMTSSCAALAEKIWLRMCDLQPLVKFVEVYPAMLTGLGGIIDEYVERLKDTFLYAVPDMTDDAMPNAQKECLAMLQDILFLTETLLPKLSEHLQKSFKGRPAASLNVRIATYTREMHDDLFGAYALSRAALHLSMEHLEEYFAKYALRRITLHRRWQESPHGEDERCPYPPGMGHAPEDPIGEDGAVNPNGEIAQEPKGTRWPGGVLDLSSETFEMDNMKVSPAFLELHAALVEDLLLASNQIGAHAASKVMNQVLLLMIQEMRQTMVEARDAAPDGVMAIGRGGLQQVLVDLTFFHTTAGTIADMALLRETVKVMEYVKLQAEVALGAGCVENETGTEWHDEHLKDVVAQTGLPHLDQVLDDEV